MKLFLRVLFRENDFPLSLDDKIFATYIHSVKKKKSVSPFQPKSLIDFLIQNAKRAIYKIHLAILDAREITDASPPPYLHSNKVEDNLPY